jgi:hypothetical protein
MACLPIAGTPRRVASYKPVTRIFLENVAMLNPLRTALRFGAVAMVLIAGVSLADAQIMLAPPPPQTEAVPPPPPGAMEWRPGYWGWNGARYVWHPGRYVHRPYMGAHWAPGHWVQSPRGWVWRPGHWARS